MTLEQIAVELRNESERLERTLKAIQAIAGNGVDPDKDHLTHLELLDLYKLFYSSGITYLDFCHRYLSFFTGLLSTIIGGMVVGIWHLDKNTHDLRAWLLLLGPIVIGLIFYLGYKIILVFYRRSVEAWLSSRNLEIMLGLTAPMDKESYDGNRILKSKHGGGFLTQFERKEVRRILDTSQTSEEALDRTVKEGDTLTYTRWLFIGFLSAGIVLAGFGIATTFLFQK